MLKPMERQKLRDCLLLIQSARNLLSLIQPDVIPERTEIENCFREADQKITRLLSA
jgi:hypothetical protein